MPKPNVHTGHPPSPGYLRHKHYCDVAAGCGTPQVGAFERDPVKIAEIIRHWFGHGRGELAAMAARARHLMHADAVFRIVEDLVGLIPEEEPQVVRRPRRPRLVAA